MLCLASSTVTDVSFVVELPPGDSTLVAEHVIRWILEDEDQ